MGRYIVTDLTRFNDPEIVCVAVVDMNSEQCFRPMPYLKSDFVQKLNIQPGAILDGNITLKHDVDNPHIEDASHSGMKYIDRASTANFKSILDRTLSSSVSSGFGVQFEPRQKHIPVGQRAACSIITVKVSPSELSIHEDQYKPGKIKATLTDDSGFSYHYLPITDGGFFDYAQKHQNDGKLFELQKFISSQQEIYLRIGVSRQFQIGDRDGYWLQVNGIYTFPNFLEEIRSY